MPRVSICVPTYNRASVIAETLKTILNQSYSNFELVVVDNASIDNTGEVVRSIVDRRLRYVRNPRNVGLIPNQNRCYEEASGELIAIYHDHDLFHCDLVKRSVEIFDKYPSVGVVAPAIQWVSHGQTDKIRKTVIEPWKLVTPGRDMRRLLLHRWNCPIMAPAAMVRRVCYEQNGGCFNVEFGDCGDREMWMRLLKNWDFGYIAEPMAKFVIRPRLLKRLSHEQADEYWCSAKNHARMQRMYVDEDYRDRPVAYRLERLRLRFMTLYHFWKAALWALAQNEQETAQMGVAAFRSVGLDVSALMLEWMRRSRVTQRSVAASAAALRRRRAIA